MEKIAAGIVTYNPDIVLLKENINSIINQVDVLFIIDNNSLNKKEIVSLLAQMESEKIFFRDFNKNRGIAVALNMICKMALEQQCDWFLSLDQDSVCDGHLIDKYRKWLNSKIGQLTCNILDRKIGNIDKAKSVIEEKERIDFCITSGALNNTKAIIQAGGYEEKLFIDAIDIDISCKLKRIGYEIVRVNYDGLIHQLGDGKIKKLFGKSIKLTYHQPWRNYYIRRNMIYVSRKYYTGGLKVKMILKQVLYALGTIIFEDKKIERIKMNFKGIIHGLKMSVNS